MIKKNFIYNLIYYFTNIFLSIVLTPYLSRTLCSEGIGIYSYTHNIVCYFALFSLLGINNYGNRLISSSRNDKEELSKQFLSLHLIQILASLIVIAFYLLYVFFICQYSHTIALIQLFDLVAVMFNISWFFWGMEKFKLTAIINLVEKTLCFVCILIFVKDSNDTLNYITIMSIYLFLSNIIFVPFLKKYIKVTKIRKDDVIKHIKPCLVLFIPVLAVGFYNILDKVILGAFSGTIEVAYYEQAYKIINIPLAVINALGVIMLPKMSNLVHNDKESKVKRYMEDSIQFIMFLIFPIVFGIISIADDFTLLFLGENFIKSSVLLKGLSFSILFIAWGSVIRTHYLIPKKFDKYYVLSVCVGAVVNIAFNLLLIPKFASVGAVVSTILAEFSVVFVQTFYVRKDLAIIKYFRLITVIAVKTFIMFVLVNLLHFVQFDSLFLKVFIQVFIGIIVYTCLNIKYINYILNDFVVLNKIKKLFKNKH